MDKAQHTQDTWFKTGLSPYSGHKIVPVDIDRHTQTSVVINGRRRSQITAYECYFPTWDAAHAHLLADAEKDVLAARRQLERANAKLGNIKGLKKPDARATEAQ